MNLQSAVVDGGLRACTAPISPEMGSSAFYLVIRIAWLCQGKCRHPITRGRRMGYYYAQERPRTALPPASPRCCSIFIFLSYLSPLPWDRIIVNSINSDHRIPDSSPSLYSRPVCAVGKLPDAIASLLDQTLRLVHFATQDPGNPQLHTSFRSSMGRARGALCSGSQSSWMTRSGA